MQTSQRNSFSTITTEGALLPADLLEQVAKGTGVEGLSPQDYELAPSELIGEAVSRSWSRLQGLWESYQGALSSLPEGDPATTVTRERWLLPLYQELGYGRLPVAHAQEIGEKTYPISHIWEDVPIHLVGARVSIDRRTPGVSGASRMSPHSLLQEFLNRSEENLWGMVSNGLRLRVLRDNSSLTRQAYVEFDLASMMEGQLYSDFVLLWLVCHKTRFQGEGGSPADCWLERWSHTAADNGTRALDQLRSGVEAAIGALGRGFLSHPENRALREKLRSGDLSEQDYYRQLLRMVYRFIFLFVAEDRDLLLDPNCTPEARAHYTSYYSTARLRRLAIKQRGTRHSDLFHSLKLVMRMLGQDKGCPQLGLPALDSFLFEGGGRGSMPDLDSGQISNHDLLDAVRELAYVIDGNVRRPVSYRSLGSEELGSVYEALLELHPLLNTTAGTFELTSAAGNERKTTGSYYTPSSLINSLLDSALDPVLEEAARKPDPVDAILALKVCDPACGSGHFLVAAAHRIAKRLASARTGDDEPSPEEIRGALREVIGQCIYGVDINPMSVELCKVSLWMEAIDPGKPLSFLDAHIKVGNSLLGTTPRLIEDGIPDEAFEPITGDDKSVCRDVKRKNKIELSGQSTLGFEFEGEDTLGDLHKSLAAINSMPDDSVEQIHEKQARYQELVGRNEYIHNKLVADAWCAAFVWPMGVGGVSTAAITTGVLRNIEKNSFNLNAGMRAQINQLAEQYQFFHWHVEFADIFQVPEGGAVPTNEQAGWRGGFDVVLGNPPWERIKLQEQEWFAARSPLIATAPNAAARKRMIVDLKTGDPALYSAFEEDLRKAEGESHLIRRSGRYPLNGRGDVNTYAVFAEGMRATISPTGRAGIIVPSGIATDDTTKYFFQDLMDSRSLASLYDFENREKLFPGVDSRMKFCLLTMSGSDRPAKRGAEFVFFALNTEHLKDEERRITLSKEDIALLNPNTRTCPIFRGKYEFAITKAIYEHSVPLKREQGVDAWQIDLLKKMVDFTIHRALLYRMEKGVLVNVANGSHLNPLNALPLYEAKLIHQYDHRYASFTEYDGDDTTELMTENQHENPTTTVRPRYYIRDMDFIARLGGRSQPYKGFLSVRGITNVTNERTTIACIRPHAPAANSVSNIFLQQSAPNAAMLLSCLNSLACDFASRQKIGGMNLDPYLLFQFPVIAPPRFSDPAPWKSNQTLRDWILSRVLELTYTAWDLQPFAKDCGYGGPPFIWNEERRFLLRCELDAAYFHLYGIRRAEVDYIMDTFPIVKRKDEAAHGEYRTKRVILEIYEAMQEAAERGEEYQTLLDPPPAAGAKPDSSSPVSPSLVSMPTTVGEAVVDSQVSTPPTPVEQVVQPALAPPDDGAIRALQAKLHYPVAHTDLTKAQVRLAIKSGLITHGGWRKGKIYGTLTCWSGKKMRPEERVFFASEEQALSLGYRPCGHCMPDKYRLWKSDIAEPSSTALGYAGQLVVAGPTASTYQAARTMDSGTSAGAGISPASNSSKQSLLDEVVQPVPLFNNGDKVRHALFGEGQVLEVTQSGQDQIVMVMFEIGGKKKLMAKQAKLKRL